MTLHYHGTPITPNAVMRTLEGRRFCVSYARKDQIALAHEIGRGVMLDNGAFSIWRGSARARSDWPSYYRWAERWLENSTTWAVIPDVIDGSEDENDQLIEDWPFGTRGAPVWHVNESLERLVRLGHEWPLVCFGSAGEYRQVGSPKWHRRMHEAMSVFCPFKEPISKIHMLRGMGQVGGPYPFASVDSTDVGRNHNRPQNTAVKQADRWEAIHCPETWDRRPYYDRIAS